MIALIVAHPWLAGAIYLVAIVPVAMLIGRSLREGLEGF